MGADPATHESANDAADERAGDDKAEQRIGGVGLGGVPEVSESRIDEVGLEAVDGAIDDGRVVAEEQATQRGDAGEQNDVRVESGHVKLWDLVENRFCQVYYGRCEGRREEPDLGPGPIY